MKEAYYFSHDSNARNDPKCSALINDFGFEGYGVFWAIVEILAEQENYKLKKFTKLYTGLSRQLLLDEEKLRSIIEAMLEAYELLVQDENYIWSESLLRRMKIKESKRQVKVEAGRKGGIKSGISRKHEAEAKQNEAPLEANEPKESKVKESKRKEKDNARASTRIQLAAGLPAKVQFAEYVSMTNAEHEKLVSTYGAADTARMVEKLDNYKGSTGKHYKSDYRTILSWVADEVLKSKQGATAAKPVEQDCIRAAGYLAIEEILADQARRYEEDKKAGLLG